MLSTTKLEYKDKPFDLIILVEVTHIEVKFTELSSGGRVMIPIKICVVFNPIQLTATNIFILK